MEVAPDIQIAGNTESVTQTVHWLQSNPAPELIFMDIHLSDGSAFNIFDKIELETPIVFTTAYDRYAIEAFKVNSISSCSFSTIEISILCSLSILLWTTTLSTRGSKDRTGSINKSFRSSSTRTEKTRSIRSCPLPIPTEQDLRTWRTVLLC